MVLEALAPFRLALMVTGPSLLAITGNSAVRAPAGMLTCAGTEATAGLLERSDTCVAVRGARDTVTRSNPGRPFGKLSVAGTSVVTTGAVCATSTAALTELVLTDAVICAVPVAKACAAIWAEVAPGGMVTLAGTSTIVGFAFDRVTVVAVACAAFSVTVSVPVALPCKASGLGTSEVTAAFCAATCTAALLELPSTLAVTVTSPALSAEALKLTLRAPAGTETNAGTCNTAELLEASWISVAMNCDAFMRSVKTLAAPGTIESCWGSSALTAAGGGTTLIPADAVRPFRVAEMPAWP